MNPKYEMRLELGEQEGLEGEAHELRKPKVFFSNWSDLSETGDPYKLMGPVIVIRTVLVPW